MPLDAAPSLVRTFDAERLNALAAELRPLCGGDGKSKLDFTDFLADHKNYALAWKHGCFLCQWAAPNTYGVDMMVRFEGRGADAYQMASRGVEYMLGVGMERLCARIEKGDAALRHYAAQAGFTKYGHETIDIGFGPVEYDLYHWNKPCLPR